MKIAMYAGILVVFLIAVSAVAAYSLSPVNATAAEAGEESSDICTGAQGGPCTEENNCGRSECAALEGRSCGCSRSICQSC